MIVVICYTEMMDTLSFSDWLQGELKKRNMQQLTLAERSGLSIAQVHRIVNAKSPPGPKALDAIAHALKIPTGVIYQRAGLIHDLPDVHTSALEIMRYKSAELSQNQLDEVIKFIEFLQWRDNIT